MTEDVAPEVIKRTQGALGKHFKKPPLTEKLLKKPPFRFLHDIISAVIRETGFLAGLFTEEELNSDNIKDKEAKLAYLTKLVDVVKITTGQNLTVKPSKIISGQEPTKTNELLQAIGNAIDRNLNSAEVIEQYKRRPDKKSKSSTKSKSLAKEKTSRNQRPSSQVRKESEKQNLLLEQKKRSASANKPSKESEVRNEGREDSSILETDTREKDQEDKEVNDLIDVPPAEPVSEKRLPSSRRRGQITSNRSKQDVLSPMSSVESTKVKPASASRAKEATNNVIEPQPLENNPSESLPITETIVAQECGGTNEDPDIDMCNNRENRVPTEKELYRNETEKSVTTMMQPSKDAIDVSENSTQWHTNTRLRSSLRPPTARPSSARPAAPRIRAKTELIIHEEICTTMGSINVIVENSDTKDDDDIDDMVVIDGRNRMDSLEESGNYKINDHLTQQHGHLVAQILETQRELVNTDNVDVLPKKVDISWETGSKRDREVMIKEIDKLRGMIQILARATNPLGKLLDYVQEDVEIMQKEFLYWRSQYDKLSKQLEKEQMETQELIAPMNETLKGIDSNMKDQLDKIFQVKARIIKNDQKIQKLLNGHL